MNSSTSAPNEPSDGNGLTFVEWADRVEGLLPTERIEIAIEPTGETTRQFSVRGTISGYDMREKRIAAACGLA